jgi:lipoprotein signal peptidase
MTEKSYRWLFWGLAVLGVVCDQTSKYSVFHQMFTVPGHKVALIPDMFTVTANYEDTGLDARADDSWRSHFQSIGNEPPPYVNKGALFGVFHDARWGNAFFAIVSVLAAGGIMFWSTRLSMAQNALHCGALGLILSGTLGNLYDRIIFMGVRDFLDFFVGNWHWPTFNIADCCLVTGASLLLLQAFFAKVPVEQPAAVASTASAKSA